ncbi:hypothetical protein BD309DRAFT_992739 [Dichomitus squalens]|uniref:Uncharacterized protein n=1 Tax=Dichomitus squalens TaxID=114155 RepID=A0A4Q9NM73_9APHY|nr:hypothetical protein BD309DRAFT_992739 [Dichomitus squalens]TBU51925.1 hypothetical protein BD310DRAFT_953003 [Dichomitus squalens]
MGAISTWCYVALQYDIDGRELPDGIPTGYVPQGTTAPALWPLNICRTETFELNVALCPRAVAFACRAKPDDAAIVQQDEHLYAGEL